MRTAIILSLCLSLSSRALASDDTAPSDTPADTAVAAPAVTETAPALNLPVNPAALPPWEISLKAGGHFPQIANRLGTNFDVILKVGYGVALDHRLQVFADFAYSQPSHTTSDVDPRLGPAGAEYSSTLTVRDFTSTLGVAYLFKLPFPNLMSYAGAGLQLHFLWSGVSGSAAGTSFGDQTETSTQVGGAAMVGVGYRLGPGALLGELRFGFTPVSQKVTGSGNIAAMSLLLGYGLFL